MKTGKTVGAAIRTTSRYRRRGAMALVMGGVLLLTAACNDDKGGSSGDSAASAPADANGSAAPGAAKASAAVLAVEPKDGAQDVAPNALQVSVSKGKLTTVEVTDKNGKPVEGAITADGSGWKPAAALAVGMAYKVNAQAKDDAGLVAASTTSFTTLTPEKKVSTNDNIADGATYGVGMIVSVDFNKDVKNKDAVLKGITFETDNGTVVKGHWFDDRRLDFRPEDYWKPGTKVTVHYRLKNVEIAPGVYGTDRDEPFTIGRSKVSTVDAAAHRMTVAENGASSDIAITSGSDEHPTWNGTMVVMSKEGTVRMQSSTLPGMTGSPYDLQVPHSMRLTTSGTYVHGNYWSDGHFGEDNVSHGCVGLRDVKGGGDSTTMGKFYADSLVGDVVIVKNSVKKETLDPANGLSGWNVPWSKW